VAGELRARYRGWLQVLADAARQTLGDRLIGLVVFGSVARQTPHEGSDIDLLVVVDPLPWGRAARGALAEAVEREAVAHSPDLPDVSLTLRTPEEVAAGFPLLLEVVADGAVVADSDGRTAQMLATWQDRLEAQGARRIRTGESWHWDLAGSNWRQGWRL